MIKKTALIFGGTGFIGRHIVKNLAAQGYQITIATRVPESAYTLKTAGDNGQIIPIQCDYSNYNAIAECVKDCEIVINCIGILYEKRKGDFTRIHADLPESIAAACAVAKVKRLIHISALGIEQSTSQYAHSKREGETRLLKAFPQATILRPSIVFGEDDDFFNKFAALAKFLPALPLIGGGKTRFQPVHVGDVAKAASIKATSPGKSQGQIYELGGPDILTFKDIYTKLLHYTGQKRALIPLPFAIAEMQAALLSLLPGKPLLTQDQVESLKSNAIVSYDTKHIKTLNDLNITPTPLDMILPDYLINYRAGGRFAA